MDRDPCCHYGSPWSGPWWRTPIGIRGGMAAGAARVLANPSSDASTILPLCLPPVVTGYLLLLTFGRRGLVGAWLADLSASCRFPPGPCRAGVRHHVIPLLVPDTLSSRRSPSGWI